MHVHEVKWADHKDKMVFIHLLLHFSSFKRKEPFHSPTKMFIFCTIRVFDSFTALACLKIFCSTKPQNSQPNPTEFSWTRSKCSLMVVCDARKNPSLVLQWHFYLLNFFLSFCSFNPKHNEFDRRTFYGSCKTIYSFISLSHSLRMRIIKEVDLSGFARE